MYINEGIYVFHVDGSRGVTKVWLDPQVQNEQQA